MWSLLMLALCSSLQERMRPSHCQALCSENATFVNNINPCNTCENRKECSLPTDGGPGCDCFPGYYRNIVGQCVLEEYCENRRPINEKLCRKDTEVFLECSCEKTCCNGGSSAGCSASCKKGCFCKNGWVRHEDGRCIRLSDCEKKNPGPVLPSPTKCGPDEQFYDCIPLCHGTCSAYIKKSYLYCKMACRSGCFCREGLYQTEDKRCVPASQCTAPNSPPKDNCGANAEYRDCGSSCPPTCANRGKKRTCTQQCVPGCFCKKGFLEDDQRVCVKPQECPKSPPPVHCSIPKCGNDCRIDYSTNPCPSCSCPGSPPVQCSMPKCDDDCSIDYSTNPCPSCSCPGSPPVQCSMPKCDDDCSIDYSTNPCPSCSCPSPPTCPLPKCRAGCILDHSIMPCPRCSCPDTCGVNEEYRGCGSACPTTCANLGKQVMCTMQCVPGCFCAKGLVRDDQGMCVPPEKCPQSSVPSTGNPIEMCNDDEEYQECGSACPLTCVNLGKNLPCTLQCVPGCFCKKGMVRNDEGECIEPENCPKNTCGKNEEYLDCGSACPPTCSNLRKNDMACIALCVKGCFCSNGLVRNDQGKCVEPGDCPQTPRPHGQCRRDQEFYKCVPRCRRTCGAYKRTQRVYCKTRCREGCFCKKGLYEREDGKCVPPSQCPAVPPKTTPAPTECSIDEQYYECIPRCMRTCTAYTRSVKIYCSQLCVPGCFCRDGLYEADGGSCVPPEQCPVPTTSPEKQCPENEEYSGCVNPCNDCQIRGNCAFLVCNKGCNCKKGYYRAPNGTCILASECPPTQPTPPSNQCGADEQYYDCIPGCQQTCFAITSEVKIACRMPCRSGCYCKEGLYQRDEGTCVPPEECYDTPPTATVPAVTPTPSCRESEEYYDCIPTCKNTCENYQAVRPICPLICIRGCSCKKGLVRRKDGECVEPEKCNKSPPTKKPTTKPITTCPRNEMYYDCKPTCKNTCENYQAKRPLCPRICIKGCACKKGYVRKRDGKCVKPAKCNKSPPTKKPTIPLPTSNPTCLLDKEVGPCRAAITRYFYNHQTGQCEKFKYGGCRGNKNNFQTKEDCQVICGGGTKPTPPKCGKDEEYYRCVPNCHDTCDTYYSKLPCAHSCMSGCHCKEGMVKNREGKCVKPSECPSTNPPVTAAPLPTNPDCLQPKKVGPCLAIFPRFFYNLQTFKCEKFTYGGCGGNKNNFRTKKACQRACESDSTPATPKCGKDEEYYGCVPNCHNTCDTYKNKGACPLYCRSGCFCRKGMVKNKAGKCVKTSQCPSSNPPSSEPPPTSNPICQQAKEVGPCKARMPRFFYNQETHECEQFVYGGCRGNQNNFETKEECEARCGSGTPTPTCGSDEQYYLCVPNCHNTCDTYNKTNIACPDICRSGCFCKEGLVKNDDGTCVPPSECNAVQPPDGSEECGEDEEYYEDCAPSCTGTCRAYNNPGIYHCPRCQPGCWCSQGLVKNSDGQCVPPDQCNDTNTTKTCSEDEEYQDCGSACPPTCSNLGKSQICTEQCVPGCFCTKGLVRNDEGECVEPEECPEQGTTPTVPTDTCSADEEYQECGTRCPPTCSNLGMDQICTKECVPGCFCKKGLVRNDQNECVKPEDCPEKTCGEDEEYNECGSACPLTCSSIGQDQVCSDQCVRGCFCKDGLVRNDKGECVEPEECPQKSPEECGEDEKYYHCAPSCGGTCDTYNKTAIILCLPCSPGCWCNEGLVKNQEGKCIPPEQCEVPTGPNKLCGVNEIYYDDCAPSCKGSCDTFDKEDIYCSECAPGCWCKKGYLRNQNGKCVRKRKCNIKRKTCPLNQKYYECMPDCQNRCNPPDACAAVCKSGYFCKEGLVMREDGKCVRKDLCGDENNGKPQCEPDQEYYDCYQSCRNSCATRNGVCPAVCESGCFCKKGLLLNSQGKCVEQDKCDECSGDNEEVVPCAKPKWCNTCGIRGNCKLKECSSGCDCKSGYYRDDSEVCIPQDQCPESSSGPSKVRCSMPRCRAGCSLDYSTKPCPSCSCTGEGTNTNTGDTPSTDNENDSSIGSSYSEESFSSMQFSESDSMSQSSSGRSTRSSESWFSGSSSGNEIDSEIDWTDESEAGYATMSSSAEEWSSNMSSDSENNASGSRKWSSSASSRSENNSAENEIDTSDDSAVSEYGYSTQSGSENWSADISDDSESISSKSSSGSRTWSSITPISQNGSSGDENDSFLSEDNSSSEWGSGYSRSSSGSDGWSSMMEEDSEKSSAKSLSGSRMWSSTMTSDFEDNEEEQEYEEFSYENDETIYEDNGNEWEEYSFSWTEDEPNADN